MWLWARGRGQIKHDVGKYDFLRDTVQRCRQWMRRMYGGSVSDMANEPIWSMNQEINDEANNSEVIICYDLEFDFPIDMIKRRMRFKS